MAKTFTITQDGESKTFTVEPGVGPTGPTGPSGTTTWDGLTGGTANHVPFDTTPTSVPTTEGTASWNSDDHTLNIQTDISDVVQQVGQEILIRVRNNSGATITNGSAVYLSGSSGTRATIGKASASNASHVASTIGIVTHDLENNSFGYVTTMGLVRGVNTVGMTEGGAIYLSETAGQLTQTPPTSNVIRAGWCIIAGVNGTVLAHVQRLSVKAADIIDSTAAGRSVLTAADAAAQRTALGIELSTTGGISKVPQIDSVGSLSIGTNSGNAAGDVADTSGPGNFWLQNMKYLGWKKADGTPGPRWRFWESHDVLGGEYILDHTGLMAIILDGRLQFGNNSTGRDDSSLQMVSGNAQASDTLRSSRAIRLQTTTWNGSAGVSSEFAFQGVPLDTSGTNNVIKLFAGASITSSGSTEGDITGTQIGEWGTSGLWTPGTAPTFDTLTASSNIYTQTCLKYKTVQVAKFTLGATNTLAISGALAGMRGILYVQQDGTGSRTLTLPNGSAKSASWALSTTAYTVDRLLWEYDGTYYYWSMEKGIELPVDADAAAFIAAASITDDTQETAINNLVLSLKGASLWSKFYALYPFVGGDATKHSYNLKAPGSYQITNSGVWTSGAVTHDANGITGNGSTAFGDTNFNFNAVSNRDDAMLYLYSRTQNPTADRYFMGAFLTTGSTSYFALGKNSGGYRYLGGPHSAQLNIAGTVDADLRGHMGIQRTSSTTGNHMMNASFSSLNHAATTVGTRDIFLLGLNNNDGGVAGASNMNMAFAAMGQSLTSGEWTTFTAIINTFQTALSRANP
jgi:hypothetical protein